MVSPKAWMIAAIVTASLAALAVAVHVPGPASHEAPPAPARAREAKPQAIVIVSPRRPAPQTVFLDGDGTEHRLADFKGRVLVVNLWATWCAPCVVELPTLDRLAAERADGEVEVLAISIDRDAPQVVPEFFEVNGITSLEPYAEPTMKIFQTLKARGLPVTLIIDRDGNEAVRVTGPLEWDGPQAAMLIDQVAGNAKTAGP